MNPAALDHDWPVCSLCDQDPVILDGLCDACHTHIENHADDEDED